MSLTLPVRGQSEGRLLAPGFLLVENPYVPPWDRVRWVIFHLLWLGLIPMLNLVEQVFNIARGAAENNELLQFCVATWLSYQSFTQRLRQEAAASQSVACSSPQTLGYSETVPCYLAIAFCTLPRVAHFLLSPQVGVPVRPFSLAWTPLILPGPGYLATYAVFPLDFLHALDLHVSKTTYLLLNLLLLQVLRSNTW